MGWLVLYLLIASYVAMRALDEGDVEPEWFMVIAVGLLWPVEVAWVLIDWVYRAMDWVLDRFGV